MSAYIQVGNDVMPIEEWRNRDIITVKVGDTVELWQGEGGEIVAIGCSTFNPFDLAEQYREMGTLTEGLNYAEYRYRFADDGYCDGHWIRRIL